MRFFFPIRPLLKGWLLSFLGWGLVAFALGAQMVSGTSQSWTNAIQPGVRDWLPWAILTPLLFRLASRLPIDRQHWKLAVPVHLACCIAVVSMCHLWKEQGNPRRGLGPGGPPRPWNEPGGPGPRGRGERDEFDGPGGPRPWYEMGERGPGGHGRPGEFGGPGGPGGPPPGFFRNGEPLLPPPDDAGRLPERRPGLPPGPRGRGFFDLLHIVSFELPIYLMLMSGAHAALFYRRSQERAASLARARLEALRMQLQPHFLFNTLNTIAGLVHEDPNKADAMLIALSDLLRLSLETSRELELPLHRELELIERYLELMHARFEERLQYQLDVAPDLSAALVPGFLLQPLVENAVHHGLEPQPHGGLVTVRAWREGEMLHLSVADNGVGLPKSQPAREGIGLANTRARLRELYGNRAALSLRDENGLTVEITLPFHTSVA